MFFIGGVSSGTRELKFSQMVICSQCGSYGRYQAYMTYMCLSLFFIPVFKWNRRYYVKMSCCGTVYELKEETGKRVARGEQNEILPGDLVLVQSGQRPDHGWNQKKSCVNCGYETTEEFEYCPKCGQKLS